MLDKDRIIEAYMRKQEGEQFSNETWDKFFDFICSNDKELPIEEVRKRLQEMGCDVEPALAKLKEMLRL